MVDADSPLSFEPGKGVVGDMTREGYFEDYLKVGTLSLNDYEIPLYQIFSTNPQNAPGILGVFWYLPLFRSRITFVDGQVLSWIRIDGKQSSFKLAVDKKRANDKYYSTCGSWVAEVKGGERIEVTHKTLDYKFWYAFGQLKGFRFGYHSPVYVFQITDREMILRENGRILLSVSRHDHPYYSDVLIETNGEVTRLKLTSFLLNEKPCGDIKREKSLLTNADLDDIPIEFTYKQLSEGTLLMSKRIAFQDVKKFQWDICTGFAMADKFNTIQVERSETKDSAIKVPWLRDSALIKRINPMGIDTSFFDSPSNGYQERKVGEKRWIEHYFTSAPALRKIRKIEEYDGNELISIVKYSYDPQGRLIRKITGNELKQYAYDSHGQVFLLGEKNISLE
ncbi:hypothetical protein GCM10007047_02680 [Cerasicoccus arenae]|uniref:RHS repeat protein n=1 Tax=Cerasicoccus arenae TaxID=424488 RepID=A0A8J3GCQ8_9BACT|nr:hypothetical protein GCM10007047_02680 [Cerasicoccus arenae]